MVDDGQIHYAAVPLAYVSRFARLTVLERINYLLDVFNTLVYGSRRERLFHLVYERLYRNVVDIAQGHVTDGRKNPLVEGSLNAARILQRFPVSCDNPIHVGLRLLPERHSQIRLVLLVLRSGPALHPAAAVHDRLDQIVLVRGQEVLPLVLRQRLPN